MIGNKPREELHLAARHFRRCTLVWLLWLAIIVIGGPFIDIAGASAWSPAATIDNWGRLVALMETPQSMASYWGKWLAMKLTWTLGSIPMPSPPLFAMLMGSCIVYCLLTISNPFKFSRSLHGGSRFATRADLMRWKSDRDVNFGGEPKKGFKGWRWLLLPFYRWRIVLLPTTLLLYPFYPKRGSQNLFDEAGIVLGRFAGRIVRNAMTLSALVLAAPGSGKTQGVALPTLLSRGMGGWSIFVFDIKGELYDDTAGWRSQFGPVLRFDPRGAEGARWNPLSLEKSLPRGVELLKARKELLDHLGQIYGNEADPDDEFGITGGRAAWGALLKRVESTDWKLRRHEVYKDPGLLISEWGRFTGIVMPENEARKLLRSKVFPLAETITDISSEQESYLERLAAGLMPPTSGGESKHFQDTGRNALIGMMGLIIWKCMEKGTEPNFAQLIDAWTEAVMQADSANGQGEDDDAVNRMLKRWIDEAVVLGFPRRVHQELTILKTKPSRERGSVLSTADTALNVFKSATVRERTSTSDFAIEDFRGIEGPDGIKRPITFYINIPQDEIKALAPILIMLTETVQARLISQPAKIAKKSIPVLMMLDEFAQIPKMEMLLKGPAVGRGQRVSSLLIAQSEGQISEVYGQDGLKQVYDTMEYRLIFPLNDEATAKKISEAVGNETIKVFTGGSSGQTEAQALMSNSNQSANTSTNWQYQQRALVSVNDLMSEDIGQKIEGGQHLLLVRRRYHRPILCDTPLAYKDKVFSKRLGMPAPPFAHAVGYCGTLAEELGIKLEAGVINKDFDLSLEQDPSSETSGS